MKTDISFQLYAKDKDEHPMIPWKLLKIWSNLDDAKEDIEHQKKNYPTVNFKLVKVTTTKEEIPCQENTKT